MATPSQEPYVPEVLVRWLEEKFPDQCPRPEDTDREIWMHVGAVNVVRKLRQVLDRQLQASLGAK
jgi:hypothetical protein